MIPPTLTDAADLSNESRVHFSHAYSEAKWTCIAGSNDVVPSRVQTRNQQW